MNLVSGECRQGTVAVQLALLPVWPCRWDSRVLRRIGKFHCKCWMMVAVERTRLTFTAVAVSASRWGKFDSNHSMQNQRFTKTVSPETEYMYGTPARRSRRGDGSAFLSVGVPAFSRVIGRKNAPRIDPLPHPDRGGPCNKSISPRPSRLFFASYCAMRSWYSARCSWTDLGSSLTLTSSSWNFFS